MFYILAVLVGAVLAHLITSYKLKQESDNKFKEFSDRLFADMFSTEMELKTKLHSEEESRRIAEAKLDAVTSQRINPEDYVTKEEYQSIVNDYLTMKESRDKLVSEQKSKEVRLGAIAETLAPFLDGFPYDPKKLRALGSPIDYIAFEDDCIVLIEIKSGDSKLNKNQKSIKDIVDQGNVRFETYRINKDGLSVE